MDLQQFKRKRLLAYQIEYKDVMMIITDSANSTDWINASKNMSVSPYINNTITLINKISGAFIDVDMNREPIPPPSVHLMIASERILSKDWNTPEEDAAWDNL